MKTKYTVEQAEQIGSGAFMVTKLLDEVIDIIKEYPSIKDYIDKDGNLDMDKVVGDNDLSAKEVFAFGSYTIAFETKREAKRRLAEVFGEELVLKVIDDLVNDLLKK